MYNHLNFLYSQVSRGYGFNSAGPHGVSIAEALDDYPLNQKPFSSHVSYHCDVSLRCMQVTAVGYVIEALEKRNIKLASSVLMHMVCTYVVPHYYTSCL